VPPEYDAVGNFHGGLALFRIGELEKARFGFLDKTGAEVIPAAFHRARRFSEGLAAARIGNLWGYVMPSGVFKIKPRFEGTRQGVRRTEETDAGCFSAGLAPVWSGEGYTFIDKAGEFVIGGAFDEARSFHDDRALVKQAKLFGFIDTTGRMAIHPQFAFSRDFSEGLAVVRKDSLCGFIDTEGKIVIRPRFNSAMSFRGGLCLVTTEDSIGYINNVGEFVWQGPYVEGRME
jgi:hypothetical protein